jgi:hypothetical protein
LCGEDESRGNDEAHDCDGVYDRVGRPHALNSDEHTKVQYRRYPTLSRPTHLSAWLAHLLQDRAIARDRTAEHPVIETPKPLSQSIRTSMHQLMMPVRIER